MEVYKCNWTLKKNKNSFWFLSSQKVSSCPFGQLLFLLPALGNHWTAFYLHSYDWDILWTRIWSFSVSILYTLDKKVYFALPRWNFFRWQVGQASLYIFYILTDFLSTCSINYWEKFGISNYRDFSLQFYQYCFEFWCSII